MRLSGSLSPHRGLPETAAWSGPTRNDEPLAPELFVTLGGPWVLGAQCPPHSPPPAPPVNALLSLSGLSGFSLCLF